MSFPKKGDKKPHTGPIRRAIDRRAKGPERFFKKPPASAEERHGLPRPKGPDLPRVTLKANEDRRIRRGHLWVFSNEVQSFPPELAPGDPVHFYTAREEFLGTGYYNAHSLIAGRLLDRHSAT